MQCVLKSGTLQRSKTVLHCAAEIGHMDLCVKLMEMGADVNVINEVSAGQFFSLFFVALVAANRLWRYYY